jgi:hypothetical protein
MPAGSCLPFPLSPPSSLSLILALPHPILLLTFPSLHPHPQIFEAVNSFVFDSNLAIVELISIEGEKIPLDAPVVTEGEANGVERWLLASEGMMHKSMASIASRAFQVRGREREGVF